MTKDFKRTDRIAEVMQRDLAKLIQQEIKDPRLPPFITISQVKVTADLSHAKVYFTAFGGDVGETTAVLTTAASYLRRALAKSLSLRTIPELHFVYDESIEYGKKLTKLIDELNPPDSDDTST